MSYREIEAMPIDVYKAYTEAMNKISAEENLVKLKISSYPHLDKQEAREEIFNQFRDQIDSDQDEEISTLELSRIIGHGR